MDSGGTRMMMVEIVGGGEKENSNMARENRPFVSLSNLKLANHVHMNHYTESLMLDAGLLFGKIGFSVTSSYQSEDFGLLHTYIDNGIDVTKYGLGVNIGGWFGKDIGVTTDMNLFLSKQITPWAHCELSIGVDGIGGIIGFNHNQTSYDFEAKVGWLTIGLIALSPYVAAIGGMAYGFSS